MELTLKDKVALVSGAGRGIGRAIALELAKEGCKVVCVSKNISSCGKVAEEINASGGTAEAVAFDVSSPAECKANCAEILKKYDTVDILINNAGITRDNLLMRMSDEEWDAVIATNLSSAFYLCRNLVRAMMGKLSEADLGRRWTPDSPTLAERLTAQGYDVARLSSGTPVVDPKSIAAFLELHIEQGVRLTQPGGPRVGLVTGIRGMVYHRMIHCWGEPAHAGAIDFPFRHDALAATTRLVAGAWERWSQRVAKGEDLVFTTGILETDPTAIFNKVPEHVRFSLDARSLSAETREGFIEEFYEDAKRLEAFHGVRFEFDPAGRNEPMESDPALLAKLEEGAALLGIPVIHEPSGAGHDAQTFGLEKIPFAMVFIANANGSHNPDEAVETDDFLAGAAVLTETVRLYTA